MCPALMFAIKRTERVIGRAIILTVSITTRNGLRAAGAPIGKRAATTDPGRKTTPETIKDNHIGKPKEKETAKCLVPLKTYGTSPIKFIRIRNKNSPDTTPIKPPKFNPKERKT